MPAPSEPVLPSGWSSLNEIPASGSVADCAARFCEIFGAARRTSPRTGFFTSWGTTSGEAEAVLPTAVPPFKELETPRASRVATDGEFAEAEVGRFLPSLVGAFEFLAAGFVGEATAFSWAGSMVPI